MYTELLHYPPTDSEPPPDAASARRSSLAQCDTSHQDSISNHQKATQSLSWLEKIISMAIVLSVMIMLIEATWISNANMRLLSERAQTVLALVFCAEFGYRMVQAGDPQKFVITGTDASWNQLDLLLNLLSLMDIIVNSWEGRLIHGVAVVRFLRILRLVRVIGSSQFLRDMSKVLYTTGDQMAKFGLVIFMTLAVCGVWSTNMLWDFPDEEIAAAYKDLPASMWTLFKLMSMDGWTTHVEQVIVVHPTLKYFYATFVFLSISSVSIVPAIFIELLMQKREKEKKALDHLKKKYKIERKESQRISIQNMLDDIDSDESFSLSADEGWPRQSSGGPSRPTLPGEFCRRSQHMRPPSRKSTRQSLSFGAGIDLAGDANSARSRFLRPELDTLRLELKEMLQDAIDSMRDASACVQAAKSAEASVGPGGLQGPWSSEVSQDAPEKACQQAVAAPIAEQKKPYEQDGEEEQPQIKLLSASAIPLTCELPLHPDLSVPAADSCENSLGEADVDVDGGTLALASSAQAGQRLDRLPAPLSLGGREAPHKEGQQTDAASENGNRVDSKKEQTKTVARKVYFFSPDPVAPAADRCESSPAADVHADVPSGVEPINSAESDESISEALNSEPPQDSTWMVSHQASAAPASAVDMPDALGTGQPTVAALIPSENQSGSSHSLSAVDFCENSFVREVIAADADTKSSPQATGFTENVRPGALPVFSSLDASQNVPDATCKPAEVATTTVEDISDVPEVVRKSFPNSSVTELS